MESIESSIVKALLYDEEFARKTFPYLKPEFFDGESREIFNIYSEIFNKYNKIPTMEAMLVTVQSENLDEDMFSGVTTMLRTAYDTRTELADTDWLVDETEKYCVDKALFNAIYKSINILEGNVKDLDKHVIPSILDEALSINFDTSIGSDYLLDFQRRFDYYTDVSSRLQFPLNALNELSNGGLPPKTLSCLLAGCVHPDTKVRVRLRKKKILPFIEKEIKISEIETLLDEYDVEIDSPDGYVHVSEFVDKGEWDEYLVVDSLGNEVSVNENHLFLCDRGWILTKHMTPDDKILKDDGHYHSVVVTRTGKRVPIVDLVIDHENHRYYANGFTSHNTNVGKSAMMCFLAGEWLKAGKNVLYITLEMSEEAVQERVDANLLDISTDQLKNPDLDYEMFSSKIKELQKRTLGKLIVKEYPTSSGHAGHFRHLIKELRQKKKFKPDIIFIDYINICASSRYKPGANANSYTIVKSIAEELRGLAVEFAVPIMTATQLNRENMNSQSVDMTATSESFGLPMSLDFFVAMITNEELMQMNRQVLMLLKTRFGNKSKATTQTVVIDWDKMRYSDVYTDKAKAVISAVNSKPKPFANTGIPASIDWGENE